MFAGMASGCCRGFRSSTDHVAHGEVEDRLAHRRERLRGAVLASRRRVFAAAVILGCVSVAAADAASGNALGSLDFSKAVTAEQGRRTQGVAVQSAQGLGEPLYDFVVAGEASEEVRREIVGGNVSIRGVFQPNMIKHIADSVLETVSSICGAPVGEEQQLARVFPQLVVMDPTTYGSMRVGITIDFRVLPVAGQSSRCASSLASAGAGAAEPPFDVIRAPLFRRLLNWHLRQNTQTNSLSTADWLIKLSLPFCDQDAVVLRPHDYPSTPASNGIESSTCGVFEGTAKHSLGLAEFASQTSADICRLASTPCVCAAMPSCAWSSHPQSGEMMCTSSSTTVVDCQYCPLQEVWCTANRMQKCAEHSLPCGCAHSSAGCFWNESAVSCQPALNSQPTDCKHCPRQDTCVLPRVEEINPQWNKWLPSSDSQWISVQFEQPVRFQLIGEAQQRLRPRAVIFVCLGGVDRPVEVFDIGMPRLSLTSDSTNVTNEGDLLHIDVHGIANEVTQNCNLIITEHAIEAQDGVPCLGVGHGEYSFTLLDTVPPRLARIVPETGAFGVALEAQLSFEFDEALFRSPNATISLVQVAQTEDSSRVSATLALDDMSVSVVGSVINIKLDGLVDYGSQYSIEIPTGAVRDRLGNPFDGLPAMEYIFRTESRPSSPMASGDRPSSFLVVSVVVFNALCCSCLIVFQACSCFYLRGLQRRELHDDIEKGQPWKAISAWDAPEPRMSSKMSGGSVYAGRRRISDASSNSSGSGGGKRSSSKHPALPPRVRRHSEPAVLSEAVLHQPRHSEPAVLLEPVLQPPRGESKATSSSGRSSSKRSKVAPLPLHLLELPASPDAAWRSVLYSPRTAKLIRRGAAEAVAARSSSKSESKSASKSSSSPAGASVNKAFRRSSTAPLPPTTKIRKNPAHRKWKWRNSLG